VNRRISQRQQKQAPFSQTESATDLGIKEKVAFVASGSKGLGKAVALELSREGARVAICAGQHPELPAAVEKIHSLTGGEVIGIAADLGISDQARDFIRKGLEHFGTVDILVHNAAGPPDRTFPDVDEDLWNFTFSIELAPYNVTVNNICPACAMTERVRKLYAEIADKRGILPDDVVRIRQSRIPMGRLGKPEEIGAPAAFPASERAGFLTDDSIQMDGGWYRGVA
jgi:NAD(P)-dependent dehydrogenase (short-subunit alcohol dehydrogenase family)